MLDYLHRSIDLDDPAIADTFDELSFWSSYFGHLMMAHVPLKHHQKVLDVGCGRGYAIRLLAEAYPKSDICEKSALYTKKRRILAKILSGSYCMFGLIIRISLSHV